MKNIMKAIMLLLVLTYTTAYAQGNKIEKEYLAKLAESLSNDQFVHRANNLFLSKCLGADVELSKEELSTRLLGLVSDESAKTAFYKRLNFYMSSTMALYKHLLEVTKREAITPDIQRNIDEFKGDYAWISRTEVGISLFNKTDLGEYFKYIQQMGEDKSLDKRCSVNSKDEVYTFTESPPQYPGGDSALMNALAKIIIYPRLEMDNDIQGKVVVRFIVCDDGTISEATVVKNISPGLDKEAIRGVRLLSKFIPGKQQGRPVKVYYTLPVAFKMR